MPTIGCWWQILCWRATTKDWAALSPRGSPTAKGDWAVTSTQGVDIVGRVTGGRPPHWQTAQETLQGGGLPCPALSDSGRGSPLKTPAIVGIQK